MNEYPRVLIIYSNPPDFPRIRLDKEHRRVDLALQRVGLDSHVVQRLHATSIDDLIAALRASSFEIVQFSGHGDPDFLYLENAAHDASVRLSANKAAQILRDCCTRLRAAIFLSCYSANAISTLVDAAPFLISVYGQAHDEAAIEFIGEFYESYLRTNSVEKAFGSAQLVLGAKRLELNPILSRRAKEAGGARVLFQVFPKSGADSVLIDLTDAEHDILSLDIDRETFLALLSRKMRIHRWIFDSPTDRVVLSIGRYFGIFSWENARDVVKCNRVFRIKKGVDDCAAEIWAGLLTLYNDHRVAKYRLALNPADATFSRHLEEAIEDYYTLVDTYFKKRSSSSVLRKWVPEQYLVTRSLVIKNLEMCDVKFHRDDHPATVEYLEAVLSALHDLVDAFTNAISVAD